MERCVEDVDEQVLAENFLCFSGVFVRQLCDAWTLDARDPVFEVTVAREAAARDFVLRADGDGRKRKLLRSGHRQRRATLEAQD